MSNTQGDLASLSRFIFSAPSWYSSVAFSLLIAALAGVAAFDSRFVLEDAWQGVIGSSGRSSVTVSSLISTTSTGDGSAYRLDGDPSVGASITTNTSVVLGG